MITAYTSTALPKFSCPLSNTLSVIDSYTVQIYYPEIDADGPLVVFQEPFSLIIPGNFGNQIKSSNAPSTESLTYDATAVLTSGECMTKIGKWLPRPIALIDREGRALVLCDKLLLIDREKYKSKRIVQKSATRFTK